eukprot:c2526_g1_i1.p1 GENE.c2526_g1_i1~~c2526_g1_i1.p1  ORF type:complete len:577 (+),score=83.29 c2526_g1_i1:37-1767(+)
MSDSLISDGLQGSVGELDPNKNKDGASDARFPCEKCGQCFFYRFQLKKHARTHTGEKPYSCQFCGKQFSRTDNLAEHVRTHTGEKPHKCEVCGNRFAASGNLTAHIRTHSGERPFICEICGKGFSQSADLATHAQSHTGDKPFRCEICGNEFARSNSLTVHMRTHTNDSKPYNCETCGKKFVSNTTLATHMRTHTGEKPFRCDLCSKSFGSKSNLTKHMRIHTVQKPFQCSSCGKGFTQSSYLNKHMRSHTGEKPFQCEVCGKSFTLNHYLSKHMRTHVRGDVGIGAAAVAASTAAAHSMAQSTGQSLSDPNLTPDSVQQSLQAQSQAGLRLAQVVRQVPEANQQFRASFPLHHLQQNPPMRVMSQAQSIPKYHSHSEVFDSQVMSALPHSDMMSSVSRTSSIDQHLLHQLMMNRPSPLNQHSRAPSSMLSRNQDYSMSSAGRVGLGAVDNAMGELQQQEGQMSALQQLHAQQQHHVMSGGDELVEHLDADPESELADQSLSSQQIVDHHSHSHHHSLHRNSSHPLHLRPEVQALQSLQEMGTLDHREQDMLSSQLAGRLPHNLERPWGNSPMPKN